MTDRIKADDERVPADKATWWVETITRLSDLPVINYRLRSQILLRPATPTAGQNFI